MKLKREIKIGFYFVLMMLALVWGVNFLKGRDIFGKTNSFYAIYENVEGLQSSSQVFVKGMKVGVVRAIKLNQKTEKFVVELQVKSDYHIPKNSVARIYSADIMGNKAIRIVLGDDESMLKNKDQINTAVDVDMISAFTDELPVIKDRINRVLLEADSALENVNRLLDEKNRRNISEGIAHFSSMMGNLESLSGSLNKSRKNITNTLSNLETITSDFSKNGNNISRILANVSDLSDSLKTMQIAGTVNELKTTLNKLNEGTGTLSKLMNDDALYKSLVKSLDDMDLLINDFRNNPKRYVNISVFGGKNK
ncbi:MAG: MlaD family protein [Prevotellaceae bacterium]|jgi:phospholipid/cholesterol/gamma-HCH transport system substrate-binding protein|nr:MlaD family protein [Prevotellaceae bacterium]